MAGPQLSGVVTFNEIRDIKQRHEKTKFPQFQLIKVNLNMNTKRSLKLNANDKGNSEQRNTSKFALEIKVQCSPVNLIRHFAMHTREFRLQSTPKSHCNSAAASLRLVERLWNYNKSNADELDTVKWVSHA